MSIAKNILKLSAAALLGCTLLSGAASASQGSGFPMRSGNVCEVQLYQSNSGGVLIAKTQAGLSGSYRFSAYQAIPVNDTDVQLSGRFSASGSGDRELTRSHLGLGYVVPGGFRGFDELRDAEYGVDAGLEVQLDVYDEYGRLICQAHNVLSYPIEFLYGVSRPQPAARRHTARQSESARAGQVRREALQEEEDKLREAHAGRRPVVRSRFVGGHRNRNQRY